MGSKSSREYEPESPNEWCMTEKYGKESIQFMPVWCSELGFPKGGSFGLTQISRLEERLKRKEEKMRKGKTVSVKDLKEMEQQKAALNAWKKEAERRDRKQASKQLPHYCSDETDEKRAEKAPQNASLYPSVSQLVKVDPDLDSCTAPPPPPYVPQQQGQQPQGAMRQQQADRQPQRVHPQPEQQAADSTVAVASPRRRPETLKLIPVTPNPLVSPPHTRTGQLYGLHDEGASASPVLFPPTLTLPMVEVAGPQGPLLVFRSWTTTDVMEASRHLPDPAASGQKFAEQLLIFCQEFRPTMTELKRLLISKMKTMEWQKIANKFPQNDLRCMNIDWRHNDNNEYRNAVQTLATEFTTVFPHRIDMSRINSCKQKENETPEEYLCRLTDIFNIHSGIEQPNDLGNTAGLWEIHLCNCFLNGLKPDIATEVKKTCVGFQDARLTELRRYAAHVHDQQTQKKKRSEDRRTVDLHNATLTMMKAVQLNTPEDRQDKLRGEWRGRGYGKGRGQWGSFIPSDVCFICGEKGHWARDCPQKKFN